MLDALGKMNFFINFSQDNSTFDFSWDEPLDLYKTIKLVLMPKENSYFPKEIEINTSNISAIWRVKLISKNNTYS